MIGVRHCGIVVSDMKRSMEFYCGLLGMQEAPVADESGEFIETILGLEKVRVKTAKLAGSDGGKTLVELLEFQTHPDDGPNRQKMHTVGPTHAAFTVSDLEDVYARLTDAGISFVSKPQRSPDGRAQVAFCYDPDGTPLELVQMMA